METVSLHAIWTVLIFICFIGIFIWAYSHRRKKEFDNIANSIFIEDEKNKKETGENNK